MANNKIDSKTKKKIQILITIIVICISIGSFVFVKLTTPPSLESALKDITFDSSEIMIESKLTNKNDVMEFTFIISEENKYIKTIKKINDSTETNIVYYKDDSYYLYQEKEDNVTIKLNDNDGIDMFNKLKLEVIEISELLSIENSNVKYYTYSTELILFSNYRDNIFYDNEITIENKKITNLLQVFTVNNVVNTINIDFIYEFTTTIPN